MKHAHCCWNLKEEKKVLYSLFWLLIETYEINLELQIEYLGGIWDYKTDRFLMNLGKSYWLVTNNRAPVFFSWNRRTCTDPRKSLSFAMSFIIIFIGTFQNPRNKLRRHKRAPSQQTDKWGVRDDDRQMQPEHHEDAVTRHSTIQKWEPLQPPSLNSAVDLIAQELWGSPAPGSYQHS